MNLIVSLTVRQSKRRILKNLKTIEIAKEKRGVNLLLTQLLNLAAGQQGVAKEEFECLTVGKKIRC
jgi:hypothetical protein